VVKAPVVKRGTCFVEKRSRVARHALAAAGGAPAGRGETEFIEVLPTERPTEPLRPPHVAR
jgi:hypothetical protein